VGARVEDVQDALGAKQRDLRVRTTDPTAGVAPPEHGERKSKVYLYSSEFLRLVSSGIGEPFRVLYAVAVFTYARAGEFEALAWDDVDVEHGVLHINKAIDRETGEVKSTKGKEARRIPIEPRLAPLLTRLKEKKTGDRVLWGATPVRSTARRPGSRDPRRRRKQCALPCPRQTIGVRRPHPREQARALERRRRP
jgi:integrase